MIGLIAKYMYNYDYKKLKTSFTYIFDNHFFIFYLYVCAYCNNSIVFKIYSRQKCVLSNGTIKFLQSYAS